MFGKFCRVIIFVPHIHLRPLKLFAEQSCCITDLNQIVFCVFHPINQVGISTCSTFSINLDISLMIPDGIHVSHIFAQRNCMPLMWVICNLQSTDPAIFSYLDSEKVVIPLCVYCIEKLQWHTEEKSETRISFRCMQVILKQWFWFANGCWCSKWIYFYTVLAFLRLCVKVWHSPLILVILFAISFNLWFNVRVWNNDV